ncbi:MAG: glycosyltransferase family 39 protein [Pseudomonadota bacterium]
MKAPARQMSKRNFVLLVFVTMLVGIGLRFVEVDKKIFWFNEIFTALRISCEFETRGHFPELLGEQPVLPSTLTAYQIPNADDGYFCIVRSLAAKDRLHPPLYYFVLRGWVDLAGFSTENLRLLSGFFSVLLLGAAGWLGRELFQSDRAGLAMAALVAVSPIFIRYAQEARSYTLWLLFGVLAAVFFLRALRGTGVRDWWLCLLLLAVAFWTHLLTISLLVSFALFLLLRDGLRLTQSAKRLALVGAAAIFLISPWLLQIALHLARRGGAAGHLTEALDPAFLLGAFGQNLGHVLLSWNVENAVAGSLALFALVALFAVSVHRLWTSASRSALLFIAALIVPCLVITIFADLAMGGQRSLRARYIFPLFVAILLAFGYLLASLSTSTRGRAWTIFVVLAAGGLSSLHAVLAPTWWGLSKVDQQVLAVLKEEPQTFVITDVVYGVIAPLGHRLDDRTAFLLLPRSATPIIAEGFERYLLYQPSAELYQAVEREVGSPLELEFETARRDGKLYRLYTVPDGVAR